MQDIPQDEMDKVSSGALPAIVALPGIEGSHGAGVAKLKRLAERAIGSDILG
jgi:vacuolar-type H+-ATPase subunit F/Vma7